MELLLKNAKAYQDGKFIETDIKISDGIVAEMGMDIPVTSHTLVFDVKNMLTLPGLADVHVHLREPGFSYKETIRTGTAAAARGGFTAICAMPNLDPVPDSLENLQRELCAIERDAVIDVFPYGAITVGEKGAELSDFAGLSSKVVAFSDDGKGVQSDKIMLSAMKKAKEMGKIITAHCEDESLLPKGWSVHDGVFSRENSLVGNPSESEWRAVERDIELVRETGCAYHVCHVSTKESVELIRMAKREGLDVTCETGPHYIALDDSMLRNEGRFRMNPPIRSAEDRKALIEGIHDGTVDMIATDHAPHSESEKNCPIEKSLNGIVGLECAFPVMYTELVRGGAITTEKLVKLMCVAPRKRFSLGGERGIAIGERADIAIFDVENEFEIKGASFVSLGKYTPFEGKKVFGKCIMTLSGGNIVWEDKENG